MMTLVETVLSTINSVLKISQVFIYFFFIHLCTLHSILLPHVVE